MPRMAIFLLLVGFLGAETANSNSAPKHMIPCKIQPNAASCYWTHGRLSLYNGTPSFRLWKIGTHRVLGIYSGPSVFNPAAEESNLDNEGPEFPPNLERRFRPLEDRIYADFEICPLEPETPGTMQAACIESAKHIFVQKSE